MFSYKSPEWLRLRVVALARAGWRCCLCGESVGRKGQARVDHIVPVRENPRLALEPTNLRVLCTRCDAARHAEKGSRVIPRVSIGIDGFPE